MKKKGNMQKYILDKGKSNIKKSDEKLKETQQEISDLKEINENLLNMLKKEDTQSLDLLSDHIANTEKVTKEVDRVLKIDTFDIDEWEIVAKHIEENKKSNEKLVAKMDNLSNTTSKFSENAKKLKEKAEQDSKVYENLFNDVSSYLGSWKNYLTGQKDEPNTKEEMKKPAEQKDKKPDEKKVKKFDH